MGRLLATLTILSSAVVLHACKGTNGDAQAVADTTDVTKDWTLSVQLWTFHKFDFTTAILKADSAGLKTVEAFPGQKLLGYADSAFGANMSADTRAKVREFLASKGMSILAYGVVVPQTAEEWVANFDFARDMGIGYITTEPLKEHWDLVDSLSGAYGIGIAIHDHPKPSVFPPRGTAALVCYKPAEGPDQDLAVSHMHEREWAPLLRGSITLGNPAERARKQIRPICSSHCTRCLQESCSPRTICDEHLYLGDCFGRSRLRLLRLRDEQE